MKRRSFLKTSALAAGAAGLAAGGAYWIGSINRVSKSLGKKVIVIGIDGMDPRLTSSMMKEGLMPNFTKIAAAGGFSDLGTSTPPQSPVAWANFINGSGPGSHGIFDFIHRHPHEKCEAVFSGAETLPGEGYWDVGDHRLQLDFWPFNHKPPETVLKRQGVPFWDYLDAAGIPSTFYDLPSNYPPSPSHHGHHRCLSGMGTPDMLGGYGTYQYFSEDTAAAGVNEGGGMRSQLVFNGDSAKSKLVGPEDSLLKSPKPIVVEFDVHRDRQSNAAMIDVQGQKILLNSGGWSRWIKLDFPLSMPSPLADQHVSGICRFFLQEVAPNFRLYVSPVNIDPSAPAQKVSEPASFVQDISRQQDASRQHGLFYTTGFQEDHKARSNGVFTDEEFLRQANYVLDERLALFEYAIENYDDGLLFFYFSSSDLQSHMFWWDGDDPHPSRTPAETTKFYTHIRQLYQKLDKIIGDINDRYGSKATIFVMSDHGFANFGKQFNLNSWLRDNDFLNPSECSSIRHDADWKRTRAYGLGINGLYLNLKGREPEGVVEPGEERERMLKRLIAKLLAFRDTNGEQVIRGVYRSDQIYKGDAMEMAPDLIIGYKRGYRASWETCTGELSADVISDNLAAWSADHCIDALEVPGVLCCNRPIKAKAPSLIDIAPSILAEFNLPAASTITGKNIFV